MGNDGTVYVEYMLRRQKCPFQDDELFKDRDILSQLIT